MSQTNRAQTGQNKDIPAPGGKHFHWFFESAAVAAWRAHLSLES
jgi:hypothetical protein